MKPQTTKWRTWEGNFGETLDLPHKTIITMFHITPSRNLQSILSQGLQVKRDPTFKYTGEWTHEVIFLEDSPEQAKLWAEVKDTTGKTPGVKNWVLLKVKVRRQDIGFSSGGWYTKTPIPPNMITAIERFEV